MRTIDRLRTQFPNFDHWQDHNDGLFSAKCDNPLMQRMYIMVDEEHGVQAKVVASAESLPGLVAHVRRHLTAEIEYQLLPTCVVPGCAEKASQVFMAAERGDLADQHWERGDEIRTCPQHGEDIYRAQGVRGLDQLAEWLRPDAKLDALDEFNASHDVLHGHAIRDSRARMLRVGIRT